MLNVHCPPSQSRDAPRVAQLSPLAPIHAFYESDDAHHKRDLLDQMEQVCRAEVDNGNSAIPLCDADSRLGWHGEACGYLINRGLIEAKLTGLREILDERIPAEGEKLD